SKGTGSKVGLGQPVRPSSGACGPGGRARVGRAASGPLPRPSSSKTPTPKGVRDRYAQIFAAPLARAASRPFRTLGGDIGSSVKRTPVALATALATAAMGGTIGVSPTPRTP